MEKCTQKTDLSEVVCRTKKKTLISDSLELSSKKFGAKDKFHFILQISLHPTLYTVPNPNIGLIPNRAAAGRISSFTHYTVLLHAIKKKIYSYTTIMEWTKSYNET